MNSVLSRLREIIAPRSPSRHNGYPSADSVSQADEESMAIFHVEDDENDALLFRKALAREIPNPITRFQNGQEVIAALKALLHRDAVSLPPLLVIDLKLPCGDGFSVLQWVRSHRELKELPMIVLTAFDRVSDIRRAGELGAMAFFLKENGFSKATEFVRELLSQSAEI